jgi:integrase
MNTYLVLALDTRKPKKDETCPILIRIVHHNKSAGVRTGIYIKPADWNQEKRIIKPSYKGTESVARLNNLLQKKKSEATDIITKLDERKTLDTYTVFELRDMIEKKSNTVSFFDYTETLIAEMIEAKRVGNALAYKCVNDVLKKYRGGTSLTFQEINLAFLNRFEIDHLKKGNTYNGLAMYMRTIRAIYNKAIKAGLVEQELYPFKSYSIKTEKTRKRAIRFDAIQKIIALTIKPGEPLFDARNYFLLSFFLRGMPFADLVHLKVHNIIDNRIMFTRQKTAIPYNVKITEEAQRILDYYLIGKGPNDFIFPVIKEDKPQMEQYKSMTWSRSRYNKQLKRLATLCGIQENLTSYVSRHSFATRAKNLNLPTASISDMLGHTSLKTTEVYLDSLPNDLMDEMHEKVVTG